MTYNGLAQIQNMKVIVGETMATKLVGTSRESPAQRANGGVYIILLFS